MTGFVNFDNGRTVAPSETCHMKADWVIYKCQCQAPGLRVSGLRIVASGSQGLWPQGSELGGGLVVCGLLPSSR